MAYRGQTSHVLCSQGGLVGIRNVDAVPNYAMLEPSRNLLLEKGGRRKRGGTAHLYESAYSGTPKILGLFDATFASGTQNILVATADGKIYSDGSTTIGTGLGTTLPYCFAMADDNVFIADGGTSQPRVWTGAGNVAQITEPAADWTTTKPFQFYLHGRGASERMCAINRNAIYFSKLNASAGDMQYFVTSAEFIYIDSGDGSGLVGMGQIGENLFVFGKTVSYLIDDSDASSTSWGYEKAKWYGGAAHWRLIINIPNDLVCMMEDGEIYSVVATSNYGDYEQASLTKASWMHEWIKDNVSLSMIEQFHGCYDPYLRAIFIFVARNGSSTIDTALVYFIDRETADAWMVFDNQSYASGYDAASAAVVRASAGSYKIYTGDYAGNIWKLNEANRHDNSNGYYAGFKAPYDAQGNPRVSKLYNKGHIIAEPKGDYNLQIKMMVDGVVLTTQTANLSGQGVALGTFILGTDTLGGDELIDTPFDIGKVGKRIQYEIYNSNTSEDFFISGYMTDYKPMGSTEVK